MSRVNIVKKIKVDGNWKLLAIPRNGKGNYDWNALPGGLYLIEWRAGGKRRRASAGVTAAQATPRIAVTECYGNYFRLGRSFCG